MEQGEHHLLYPEKIGEGYGLHQENLAKAVRYGCRLVVTVDCGVTALEEAEFLRSKGVDLLVTDHHEPGAVLPEATAVVNPKTTPVTPAGNWPGLAWLLNSCRGWRRSSRRSGGLVGEP